MKTKFAILGSLTIAGAAIWYKLYKNRRFKKSAWERPASPTRKEESGPERLRQVFHTAKVITPNGVI